MENLFSILGLRPWTLNFDHTECILAHIAFEIVFMFSDDFWLLKPLIAVFFSFIPNQGYITAASFQCHGIHWRVGSHFGSLCGHK